MKILINYLVFTTILSLSSWVAADRLIIVHPKNTSNISSIDVNNLFLAKTKTFPNGQLAIPINLPEGNTTRITFDKTILKKTPQQVKAHWARLIFSGEASPLKVVDNDSQVIDLVSKNESVIGYIDEANVTDNVKVVATFK